MNDLERDLKELFDRKLTELRVTPAAPPKVLLRRTRRRQGATVGIAVLMAGALALGSVAGLRLIGDRSTRLGTNDLENRTARGVTISVPNGWHFEEFPLDESRDEGANAPLFTLSSFVPPAPATQLTAEDLCDADGVVLAMTEVLDITDPESFGRWPATFGPAPASATGCEIREARWTANDRFFIGTTLIGNEAPAEDELRLRQAFESLQFAAPEPGPTPTVVPTPSASPPSPDPIPSVIVTGEDFGVAWELEFTKQGGNVCVSLETGNAAIGMCAAEPAGPQAPVEAPTIELGEFELGQGNLMLAGSISAEVASVVGWIEPDGGEVVVEMVDLTDLALDPPRRGFHVELPGIPKGGLVALDLDGNEIDRMLFGRPSGTDELPQPVPIEHGGTYWAVYFGVGEEGSAELEAAVDFARQLGIDAGSGELACDQGAAEALGVPERWHGVGVYFATRDDAERFYIESGLADHEVAPPIAKVTTFCLD